MPTISVVIPSFNSEAYIVDTIGSVLDQTFKDIEVIVVDDGSKDRTLDLVLAFGFPVRLVTQANSGVCAARNRGISEAKGKFICFLDHDDYWLPNKLARQIAAFDEYPEAGVVYSELIWWWPEPNGAFPASSSYDLAGYDDDTVDRFSGWIYHEFLLDCPVLTSTTMFRAEVFDSCGAFDVSLPYSEDWDLFLRASQKYPYVMLRRPTTLYRQHPHQGNRVVRDVDYRTVLLNSAVEKWGYCSRDGRCITKRAFSRKIAEYHAAFALNHVKSGKLETAMASLLKAWRADPLHFKYLAYIPAALMGWKPSW